MAARAVAEPPSRPAADYARQRDSRVHVPRHPGIGAPAMHFSRRAPVPSSFPVPRPMHPGPSVPSLFPFPLLTHARVGVPPPSLCRWRPYLHMPLNIPAYDQQIFSARAHVRSGECVVYHTVAPHTRRPHPAPPVLFSPPFLPPFPSDPRNHPLTPRRYLRRIMPSAASTAMSKNRLWPALPIQASPAPAPKPLIPQHSHPSPSTLRAMPRRAAGSGEQGQPSLIRYILHTAFHQFLNHPHLFFDLGWCGEG